MQKQKVLNFILFSDQVNFDRVKLDENVIKIFEIFITQALKDLDNDLDEQKGFSEQDIKYLEVYQNSPEFQDLILTIAEKMSIEDKILPSFIVRFMGHLYPCLIELETRELNKNISVTSNVKLP